MAEIMIPHENTPESWVTGDISTLLENFAGDVNLLTPTNSEWVPLQVDVIEWHINKKIVEAEANWEFYLFKRYQGIEHILDLYATKDKVFSSEKLHWNNMFKPHLRKRRKKSLELIAYLKLAKELWIKTLLNKRQIDLLDNLWEEIDIIALWLKEDLGIPLETKIAA